jgi:hypothetical protein
MGDVGDVGSMGVRLWIIDGLGLEDGGGLGGDGGWVGVFFIGRILEFCIIPVRLFFN